MIAAPELARRLADLLEGHSIPYAVGGSLALAVWDFQGLPTMSILFIHEDEMDDVMQVLINDGMELNVDEARRSVVERGDFRGFVEGMRVDLFVPSIPLYESARDRVREAPLLEAISQIPQAS